MVDYSLAAKFYSELLSTTIFIFLGDSVVANALLPSSKGHGMGFVGIAFGWGIAIGMCIAFFGTVSAVMNPAMYLFLFITNKVSLTEAVTGSIADFIGGFFGGVLVYVFYMPHFGETLPLPTDTSEEATLVQGPAALETNAGRIASAFGEASKKHEGNNRTMKTDFRRILQKHRGKTNPDIKRFTRETLLTEMELEHMQRVAFTESVRRKSFQTFSRNFEEARRSISRIEPQIDPRRNTLHISGRMEKQRTDSDWRRELREALGPIDDTENGSFGGSLAAPGRQSTDHSVSFADIEPIHSTMIHTGSLSIPSGDQGPERAPVNLWIRELVEEVSESSNQAKNFIEECDTETGTGLFEQSERKRISFRDEHGHKLVEEYDCEYGKRLVDLYASLRGRKAFEEFDATSTNQELEKDPVDYAFDAALQADQFVKLSIFCTRPAIYNRPMNFLQELMLTCIIILGVHMTLLRQRLVVENTGSFEDGPFTFAIMISLFVTLMVLAVGGPTGLGVNPARDLGPRIAHAILPIPGKGDSEWHYGLTVPIFGPFAGAATAAAIFLVTEAIYDPSVTSTPAEL